MALSRRMWLSVAGVALACSGSTGPAAPSRSYRMGFSAIPPRNDLATAPQRSLALFQLTFADLDLSGLALPPGSILPLFAHLGVVDSAFRAKPALGAWDSLLARRRIP